MKGLREDGKSDVITGSQQVDTDQESLTVSSDSAFSTLSREMKLDLDSATEMLDSSKLAENSIFQVAFTQFPAPIVDEQSEQKHNPEASSCTYPKDYCKAESRVAIKGNPDIGKLAIYGQTHDGTGVSDFMKVGEIAESQYGILRDLLDSNVPIVFDEGFSDWRPLTHSQIVASRAGKEILAAFPNKVLPPLEELTLRQRKLLCENRAAYTYCVFNKDAALHPTSDITQKQRIDAEYERREEQMEKSVQQQITALGAQRGKPLTKEEQTDIRKEAVDILHSTFRKEIVHDLREREAIALVSELFEQKPGESAALVFGSAHHWNAKDFGKVPEDQLPSVSIVSIPGVSKWYGTAIGRREVRSNLLLAKLPPEEQQSILKAERELVKDAKYLDSSSFDRLLDDQSQIEAIPKVIAYRQDHPVLEGLPDDHPLKPDQTSWQKLKDFLIARAQGENVVKKIDAEFSRLLMME